MELVGASAAAARRPVSCIGPSVENTDVREDPSQACHLRKLRASGTELREGHTIWLFAGSDRGGRTAAVRFSMIASCKLNDMEPWTWLRDVLRRIPDIATNRLPQLPPDRWQATRTADAQAADASAD